MVHKIDPFVIPLPKKWVEDNEIRPYAEYLNRFLHDLFFSLTIGTGGVGSRTLQVETLDDYTTTGNFDHEIVVCINTTPITITLQTLSSAQQVSITRAGTGAVTIDGNTFTILGESTQTLDDQYDVVNLTASTTEWVLKA